MKPCRHGLYIKKFYILLYKRFCYHIFNNIELRIPICSIFFKIHIHLPGSFDKFNLLCF